MKTISSRKYIDLFRSEFNKIILDVTTPYFELVGGVTQHLIFNPKTHYFLMVSHQSTTKLTGFYSKGVPTILLTIVYN